MKEENIVNGFTREELSDFAQIDVYKRQAIRYALTNDSERDYIVRNGESEGEILIETDTGLLINRKKRSQQADYKSVKDNGQTVQRPESFLNKLFTPMQLNPVEFASLPKQEQNRIILDLIEFDWDLNWIREKFGEIPEEMCIRDRYIHSSYFSNLSVI